MTTTAQTDKMTTTDEFFADTMRAIRESYERAMALTHLDCDGCGETHERVKMHDQEGFGFVEWFCEVCWNMTDEDEEEDEDEFEDCEDCGYTHHYEDKCPIGEQCEMYEKWRVNSQEQETVE